jgi:hypothetical protein
MICSSLEFFLNNPDPKMYRFKKICFCNVKMICSSNVFLKKNPDLNPDADPKLRLKPDPNTDTDMKKNNFGSTTLHGC